MKNLSTPRRFVAAVGWMSVTFGVFDFLMADKLAAKVGMKDGRIFRAAGLREIATGAGAIAFPEHPLPLAARLIGDAGDIAVLGALGAKRGNPRGFAAWIGVGVVVAVTAIDILAIGKRRAAANPG